jgi:hypothetical protein
MTAITPQVRRGKRLFLILAGFIILDKLAGVGLVLAGGLPDVKWLRSAALPVGFALAVACLWQGDIWLRWLVGVACIVSGGFLAFISGQVLLRLAAVTAPEAAGFFMRVAGYPIGLVGLFGLIYVLVGLLFLFSPSMRAFFKYQRQRQESRLFLETIDALNAESRGGEPITGTKLLGNLKLRSGTLVLGDSQCMPSLEVPNIVANEVPITASLRQYPSGGATVKSLRLSLGEPTTAGSRRKIGEVGIDSAKLVVADKADIQEHWTETGEDRIGVITTARDDTVLRMLTKRFKLKTIQVNLVRAEVVGPVSETLAKEIEDYLKSNPEYADYPFLYFHVQTNNSFERANYLAEEWAFIPVGNADTPLMFVCGTGRGDGVYDVECEFSGEVPRVLFITFIK